MSHSDNQTSFQTMLDNGMHCSQCVFGHWAEQLGIDHTCAMRLASGLGLGVNHGDSCGAVTATTLALGLVYGFSDKPESGTKGVVEKRVREFNEAFIERNGSILCRDLLSGGYDGADPDASAPEGVDPWENCAKYCADAVELAEQYLTPEAIESARAFLPSSGTETQGAAPSYALAAGTGVAGAALGAIATLAITYEKRRAENENKPPHREIEA